MTVLKAETVIITDGPEIVRSEAVQREIAEAHAQGYEEGRIAADAERTAVLARLRATLDTTQAASVREIARTVELDGSTVVALAADLACWFLEGAVHADPSLLTHAADAALANAGASSAVRLHVHPGLLDAVRGVAGSGLTVVADDTLGPADHRVQLDGASVERIWSEAIADVGPAIAAAVASEADG